VAVLLKRRIERPKALDGDVQTLSTLDPFGSCGGRNAVSHFQII
jgi:hypothetical protein